MFQDSGLWFSALEFRARASGCGVLGLGVWSLGFRIKVFGRV